MGEPGMTLYEIDEHGWIHRQMQFHGAGTRFVPEQILMCRPVNTDAMARHPATEEIDAVDFDLLWADVADERPFMEYIPDAAQPWHGTIEQSGRIHDLHWLPSAEPFEGMTAVPGFLRLFVDGDAKAARAVAAAIFVERPIAWTHVARVAA
jgi:hypothetical protein